MPRSLGQPRHGCVQPFLLGAEQPPPLGASKSVIAGQYNHGKMNGFVAAYQRQGRNGSLAMGYYDRRELPYYWNVASRYVLFDHFFSSAIYGVRTNRSYWVSAAPAPGGTGAIPAKGYGRLPTIFDLLQAAGISWKFYVEDYRPGDTYRTAGPANPETQTARVPLVDYSRFTRNPVLAQHIVGLDPVLPGPVGRDFARRRLHRQRRRGQRTFGPVHNRRAEPGPQPGDPAHGEPLLGQFSTAAVL